ncbi:unnamed protein product [Calypogeia fissa]
MAAKSVLLSMKGAVAKIVGGTDSPVRLITLEEADDEAFDHEATWEHAEELPSGVEEVKEQCYKVSTRTEKRQERLKALKDKRAPRKLRVRRRVRTSVIVSMITSIQAFSFHKSQTK